MPIEEKFAKAQLKRLCGMSMEPTEPAAIRERVKALASRSRSETHAQRIVDSLLETSQFFPTVADICQSAEYISGDSLPPGCQQCGGASHVTVERNGVEAAVRCDCERGRYLKARDSERRGGRAA